MYIGRETETVEFKKTTGELPAALVSISAILNKHQKGILYFGVLDNGKVIGQQVGDNTIRDITNNINNKIKPKIRPKVYKSILDEKELIIVEFEGEKVPYSADGRYYMRVGDEDQKLEPDELNDLFKKFGRNIPWEEQDSGKTIEDIDEETLVNFIQKANKIGRIKEDYIDKETTLKNLNLVLKNGNLKNAGFVLFGKQPQLLLRCAIFAGNDKTTILDMKDYVGNIFELVSNGMLYISEHIMWVSNFKTGKTNRVEIPEIPLDAIREALWNSFCHRDWDNQFDNHIAIFKDRIEIDSPGSFYSDSPLEDYIELKASSKLRNPLIAKIIYLSGEIETWGTGIRKISNLCKSLNVKYEYYIAKSDVFVCFYRKTSDELIEVTKVDMGEEKRYETLRNIDKNEKEVLLLISENPNITQSEVSLKMNYSKRGIEKIIRKLKDKGLIERVGSNKSGYWKIK